MKRLLAFLVVAAVPGLFDEGSIAQVPVQGSAQQQAAARGRGPAITKDQVEKGRAVYDVHCVSCHGPSLSDGSARSLTSRDFRARWNGQSPAELRDAIRRQTHPGRAGTLSAEQYTQLVALLMKENGYTPGEVALSTDDATVARMRMQFAGVRGSSAGPLALDVTLPSWPKTDPTVGLTPVTDAMLRNPAPGDWLTWRRTQDGLGFSPLTQITAKNVSSLQLVWSQALASGSNISTPLVHDGVIFAASAGNNVDALNAKTGEPLWSYKPEAGGGGGANRSMALYGDKLYLTLGRGTLGTLDARTGKLVSQTKLPDNASGGPLVANGRIFQGVGFYPGAHGSMPALDAKTGAMLWRWFAIPKTGEPGGNTWGDVPDDKRHGASIWTTAYFDYELNLVYFGTANTYDTAWLAVPTKTPGVTREALFTNSTIALNPETGKMAWYFQHQAGDPFDLDYAFERMILTLSIAGKMTKVVVTMGKPGLLDAMDAATGKFLFTMDAGVQNFVTHIDPVTGAKTINPRLIPSPGEEKIKTVCPNWIGVKNWLPGAINPNTKVAFMALNESCMDLTPTENAALTSGVMPETRPVPNSDGRYGRVQAFDLQNRKVLWTERQHAPMTSGVVATAGGVVFAGGLDQTFSAYDQRTGKKLWSTRLTDVPSSAPITYMVDGRQYVAMVVGFGSQQSTGFVQLVPDIVTPARPSSAIYVFALP